MEQKPSPSNSDTTLSNNPANSGRKAAISFYDNHPDWSMRRLFKMGISAKYNALISGNSDKQAWADSFCRTLCSLATSRYGQ